MPNMLVFRPADGNEVSGEHDVFPACFDDCGLCECLCAPGGKFPSVCFSLPQGCSLYRLCRRQRPFRTSGAYAAALSHSTGPSVLALSRQNVPNLATSSIDNVKLGAYTVFETAADAAPELVRARASALPLCCVSGWLSPFLLTVPSPPYPARVIAQVIVSTGSEVGIAIEGAKKLAAKVCVPVCVCLCFSTPSHPIPASRHTRLDCSREIACPRQVRVVSMPCSELFDAQPEEYR
jgi:transketolase